MRNFCGRCNCSARAAAWSYVIASYLGSNRIFKIFNSKWSYDKMLIDWVRSGRTGKHLALGRPWPRAKYFPVRPSHSVNKYIIFSPLGKKEKCCFKQLQHAFGWNLMCAACVWDLQHNSATQVPWFNISSHQLNILPKRTALSSFSYIEGMADL